ncbi:sulfatase [Rosistilla oblonga]|uniref:Arylsulfatase n=1 Tax=Rosistilla oblonga TaxID=2527990 RepID=A0A518INZ6_9BACT|nr:sulfatase [Rosistilla oblonga]QDV54800.1 Arylsulfatase [Rosistilla oblonga]
MKPQTRWRRPILLALITFAAVGSFGLTRSSHAADTTTPPNIVMLISDDQAWGDYSFMGHDAIQTPNLDRLAKQSVLFRRGYVPTALCRPSLLTLINGRYASQHGVTGNDPSPKYSKPGTPENDQQRAQLISYLDRFPTVPQILGGDGYLSMQSGKWWEGNYKHGGFTHGMTRGFPQPGGRHGDDGLKIGRAGMKPVTEFIDMAVEEKKPFYLWYAPFLPHTPHNPPKRLLDKYTQAGRPASVAKYYAMCDWFDETCGQVIDHLDAKGLRENTLIVYVTDNGWIQDPNSSKYAARSKQTPYEGGIRTPIMFSWPGKLKPADREELCSSLDIVPTVLAAAGAEVPADLPGLNLMPGMTSGEKIDRQRIFGESFAHDIADIENPEASLLYRWCIEGRWKLLLTYDGEVNRYQTTHPRTERRPQLFDLIADPAEEKNLAAENPAVVKRLADAIEAWYPVTQRKTQTTF